MMDEVALVPWTASAVVSQKENVAPDHSLCSFLMEMTAPCTDKHTDTLTQCVVGTGQGCSPQRGRLTSENSLRKAPGSYTLVGEIANEKARGPRQKSPPPRFQGKMPRAIKTASSNWMEKADVPYSGLKEVRAEGNAFRNALRDM